MASSRNDEVRRFSFAQSMNSGTGDVSNAVSDFSILEGPVLPPPAPYSFIFLGMASNYGWVVMSMSLVVLSRAFGQHLVTFVGFYYGLSSLIAHIVVLRIQKKNEKAWPVETRIKSATKMSLFNAACFFLFGLAFRDQVPSSLLMVIGPLLTVLTGATDAVFVGAVMGVASTCGGPQLVNASIGLVLGYLAHLPLLALFKFLVKTDENAVMVFYGLALFIIVAGFFLWECYVKPRVPSATKFIKLLKTLGGSRNRRRKARRTRAVFWEVKVDMICNTLQATASYIVWPAMIKNLTSSNWGMEQSLFYTLLSYSMACCELAGRVLSGFSILQTSTRGTVVVVIIRCVLLVFMGLTVSPLIEFDFLVHDIIKVAFPSLQTMMGGYLSAMTAVNASRKVRPLEQRTVGLLTTLTFSTGIVIGSILGALADALLKHEA